MKTLNLILLAVLAAAVFLAVWPGTKQLGADLGYRAFAGLTKLMHRQGMLLTVNFFADLQNVANGPAFGQPLANRVKANKLNGRIRFMEAVFVAPAAGAAPAIADKIIFGKLPAKSRIVGHLSKLYWNAGTAACTLALGDSIVPARHLAATAITALGNALVEASAQVNAAVGDITIGSNVIQNVKSIGAFASGSLVVGAGVPLGSTVTGIDYNSKTVTISAVATATTAALALTVTGSGYETQDDSNNVNNGFGSLTDDCTLIGTVAGAQVANNQVITLKVAYVQD